jgi:hypothetical protein
MAVYARFTQSLRRVYARFPSVYVGLHMVYAWFMQGLCRFTQGLRKVYAESTQSLRKVYATFMQGLRRVYAEFT